MPVRLEHCKTNVQKREKTFSNSIILHQRDIQTPAKPAIHRIEHKIERERKATTTTIDQTGTQTHLHCA